MKKRTKILSGMLALAIGLSAAMPMRASADDWTHHEHHEHQVAAAQYHDAVVHHDAVVRHDEAQRWRWEKDHEHYRAYPYTAPYAYGNRANPYRQAVPANGQGMISRDNPNLYWACDSDGHNCHWAPRR
jgi:hypothetical protein